MIKIEKVTVRGFDDAIRGMRNPLNSWAKSDSEDGFVGPDDYALMARLSQARSDHAKFRRMITVWADITAPLYWWKEYDTYKVGTVANSCSTMHTIANKEFEAEDFSHDHLLTDEHDEDIGCTPLEFLDVICFALNKYRKLYLETGDKKWWWQMIQLLPSSYNQKRTVMLNYEVLSNIYRARKEHKLDEWRAFCSWIENLPYAEGIIFPKGDGHGKTVSGGV